MINSLRPANAFSGDDKRCEIKFVIGGIATEGIEPWIQMHPAHFRRAYEPRWVNSIYFDNADLSAYRNNLSGISNREKVRFRWYGDLEGAKDGNLEIKIKRNSLGSKKLFHVTDLSLVQGDTWEAAILKLRKRIDAEALPFLDMYHLPVVAVRYFRKYFISANNMFRITVDHRLVGLPQFNGSTVNLRRTVGESHLESIIEVKYSADNSSIASHIIESTPARRSRYSKYVSLSGFALDGGFA